MRWRPRNRSPLLLALLWVCGCVPPAELGKKGKLAFYYRADEELFKPDLSRAIASGAHVDVAVGVPDPAAAPELVDSPSHPALGRYRHRLSDLRAAPVKRAASSDPGVLSVVQWRKNFVVLEAHQPGRAELRVGTDHGSDTIDLKVAALTNVKLSHLGPDLESIQAWSFAFLRGGAARFVVSFRDHLDRPLVGYGYAEPVSVTPESAATVQLTRRQQGFLDVVFRSAGLVRFTPQRATPLVVHVVDTDQIAAIGLAACKGGRCKPLVQIDPATSSMVLAQVKLADGRRALGLDGLVVAKSVTPSVCRIEPLQGAALDGSFVLRGSPGRCVLDMSAAHVTQRVPVLVKPFPQARADESPRPG